MAGDTSAYVAPGLEPGANSATIDQSYIRLIKEYHPDRDGGDARRSAEIKRAHRELRAVRNLKDPLELNEEYPDASRRARGRSDVSALSDDAVAIDGRLDRIRSRVEVALRRY